MHNIEPATVYRYSQNLEPTVKTLFHMYVPNSRFVPTTIMNVVLRYFVFHVTLSNLRGGIGGFFLIMHTLMVISYLSFIQKRSMVTENFLPFNILEFWRHSQQY